MGFKTELTTLLVTIEDLRQKLNHSVMQGKSISDPSVIKLSQDLDEQLNKYHRIKIRNLSGRSNSWKKY